jgi:tol-pal system protein YbgF
LLQALCLGASLVVSSAALSAPKNNQQLTDDLSALQQSIGKVESEMQQLGRLLDNRAMLELFQRMDELADEVSQLRGLLEQQNHDLAGLKKRQRELYLDTDRRLRELENISTRAPAPALPSTPVTPEPPAAVDVQTQGSTADDAVVPAPPAQPLTGVAKPASIQASNKPDVPVSEEREAYQEAFDMLKEGRYKMANTAFKEFLGRFPRSSYAGNAQYWLGESNYVNRQFEQAVEEFEAVVKNYPTSNKVPDAMLKLGYTYYELRQFEQAETILQQIQSSYANTTAARLAGQRLNRMRKEGR